MSHQQWMDYRWIILFPVAVEVCQTGTMVFTEQQKAIMTCVCCNDVPLLPKASVNLIWSHWDAEVSAWITVVPPPPPPPPPPPNQQHIIRMSKCTRFSGSNSPPPLPNSAHTKQQQPTLMTSKCWRFSQIYFAAPLPPPLQTHTHQQLLALMTSKCKRFSQRDVGSKERVINSSLICSGDLNSAASYSITSSSSASVSRPVNTIIIIIIKVFIKHTILSIGTVLRIYMIYMHTHTRKTTTQQQHGLTAKSSPVNTDGKITVKSPPVQPLSVKPLAVKWSAVVQSSIQLECSGFARKQRL